MRASRNRHPRCWAPKSQLSPAVGSWAFAHPPEFHPPSVNPGRNDLRHEPALPTLPAGPRRSATRQRSGLEVGRSACHGSACRIPSGSLLFGYSGAQLHSGGSPGLGHGQPQHAHSLHHTVSRPDVMVAKDSTRVQTVPYPRRWGPGGVRSRLGTCGGRGPFSRSGWEAPNSRSCCAFSLKAQ